jgi:multiple sugar transport system permease protein
VMVIYREAFTKFNLGLGAAISVLLLAVLVLVNVMQLRIIKRGE